MYDICTVQDLWSAGVTETALPGALVGFSPDHHLYILLASIYSFFASLPLISSVAHRWFLGRPHLQLHNWPTVPQPKIWRQVFRNRADWRHFFHRFFYENGGWPSSFTLDQLEQIRRFSLARLLCDNTDQIETIQVQPNLKKGLREGLVPICTLFANLPKHLFFSIKETTPQIEHPTWVTLVPNSPLLLPVAIIWQL